MELGLRPYVTAGVVVAGAGFIAAAPLGPPALEIQTRAVQLASVDALGADLSSDFAQGQEFPTATWADVSTNTLSNLETIGSQFTGDPTPILSAIITNQLDYGNELATGAETSATNLVSALQDGPDVLSKALRDLTSGDVYQADQIITQYLTETPLSVSRPLDNAFFDVAQSIANNVENVLSSDNAYQTNVIGVGGDDSIPQWFSELVQAPLLAPHAAEEAFAGVSQDIVNALQNGNDTLAVTDLENAGSTVVNAFLNGYDLGDDGGGPTYGPAASALAAIMQVESAQGLLSENGTIETEREATETVAREITERARELVTADGSASADSNLVGDISSLLNPSTALGDFASALDPNAVADITSLLTGDLAPNASGWVVDVFSLF